MSRTSALILLGVLVMLVPFSGLPIAFRTLLLVLFGILVLGIGLSLRSQEVHQAQLPLADPTPEPDSSAAMPPTSASVN